MTKNVKLSLALVAAAVLVLLAVAALGGEDDTQTTATDDGSVPIVREDSHRLSEGSTDAVFVEFLDFECEGCRAAYPAVEQLREEYGDEVTFVVRHFPLHANSEEAARATEAAADQGHFEEMYQRLFETQLEWGHQSSSQRDVFFGYAEDMGLDMDRFEAVYDDPATLDKIRRDKADGEAVGVTGTPTFFLDGEELEIRSFDDLVSKIEAAADA